MSTFFFRTNISSVAAVEKLRTSLDKLKEDQSIDSWHVDPSSADHLLQIETVKLSSKEVEHLVRAAGFDVEFTKAPQAR
jgi:hypothetical protein